jgi:hypothetical protein
MQGAEGQQEPAKETTRVASLRGALSIVFLALWCSARAGAVRLPDPPQVPSGVFSETDEKALNAKRADLLTEKRNIVRDLAQFNKEVDGGVPEGREAYYQEWHGRLRTQSVEYRQKVDRFGNEHRLAGLRAAVRRTQDALRRLDASIQSDVAQLAEWQQTTEETVAHAKEMGVEVLTDALLTIPQDRLGKLYKGLEDQASSELQRVVTLLAGETNADRREQLHSAFKLLSEQRGAIRGFQELLTNLQQARAVTDLSGLLEMPDSKRKLGEGVLQLLNAIGDEGLQDSLKTRYGLNFPALTLLGTAATHYRYGEKVVDAAYDVTAVCVSWARIRQLNRGSAEYLEAVGHLHERMKKLVGQIQDVKEQLN